MKPGRSQTNKRCPCGSGRAHKNCCGKEGTLPGQISVPFYPPEPPLLAAPGYTNLAVTFAYEGDDEPRSPAGEPGEYKATFTLLPPGQAAEKVTDEHGRQILEVADEKAPGDSHLVLCSSEAARSAEGSAGARLALSVSADRPGSEETGGTEIKLVSSGSGRASKVFVRTVANDFDDAERRAYFEASSFLSELAFKLDIPLRIAHTHLLEVATGHTKTGFVRQFGYRSLLNLPEFGAGGNAFAIEMKAGAFPALASIYRDALNSDSPFYQVLCFCRIIQRLVERLRPRWKATFREHGVALPLYLKEERLPSEEELAQWVPEPVRGKKFTSVYQDHLRPLRNGIGHVFLEDEEDQDSEERSTDELGFVTEAYHYLPVAHLIARAMLEKDFGPGGLARIASELQARGSD